MKPATGKKGKHSLSHDDDHASKRDDKYPRIRGDKDVFCWGCHKPGKIVACSQCPRAYHPRCAHLGNMPPPKEKWICPECDEVQRADKRASLTSEERKRFSRLLRFVFDRIKLVNGYEHFSLPVDTKKWNDYLEYIITPMDLRTLSDRVDNLHYQSTEAFLADFRWLRHNSYIYNSCKSGFTKIARDIHDVVSKECEQIRSCADCYWNAYILPADVWFVEACSTPHVLVWAKQKSYSFWPAKVVKQNGAQLHVHFFGDHTVCREVPMTSVFLYSHMVPTLLKKDPKLTAAVNEAETHVKKLKQLYKTFYYAQYRVPYVHKEERLMRKLQLPGFQLPNETPEFLAEVEVLRKEKMKVEREFQTEVRQMKGVQGKPVGSRKRKSQDRGHRDVKRSKVSLVQVKTPTGTRNAIVTYSESESDSSPGSGAERLIDRTKNTPTTPTKNKMANPVIPTPTKEQMANPNISTPGKDKIPISASSPKLDNECIQNILAATPPEPVLIDLHRQISPKLNPRSDTIVQSLSRKLFSSPQSGGVGTGKSGAARRRSPKKVELDSGKTWSSTHLQAWKKLRNGAMLRSGVFSEEDSDSDALTIASCESSPAKISSSADPKPLENASDVRSEKIVPPAANLGSCQELETKEDATPTVSEKREDLPVLDEHSEAAVVSSLPKAATSCSPKKTGSPAKIVSEIRVDEASERQGFASEDDQGSSAPTTFNSNVFDVLNGDLSEFYGNLELDQDDADPGKSDEEDSVVVPELSIHSEKAVESSKKTDGQSEASSAEPGISLDVTSVLAASPEATASPIPQKSAEIEKSPQSSRESGVNEKFAGLQELRPDEESTTTKPVAAAFPAGFSETRPDEEGGESTTVEPQGTGSPVGVQKTHGGGDCATAKLKAAGRPVGLQETHTFEEGSNSATATSKATAGPVAFHETQTEKQGGESATANPTATDRPICLETRTNEATNPEPAINDGPLISEHTSKAIKKVVDNVESASLNITELFSNISGECFEPRPGGNAMVNSKPHVIDGTSSDQARGSGESDSLGGNSAKPSHDQPLSPESFSAAAPPYPSTSKAIIPVGNRDIVLVNGQGVGTKRTSSPVNEKRKPPGLIAVQLLHSNAVGNDGHPQLKISSAVSLSRDPLTSVPNGLPAIPLTKLKALEAAAVTIPAKPITTTNNSMPLPFVVKVEPTDVVESREVAPPVVRPTIKVKQMSALLERPLPEPEHEASRKCTTPKHNMIPPFEAKKIDEIRTLIETKKQFISAKLMKDIFTLLDEAKTEYETQLDHVTEIADRKLRDVTKECEAFKDSVFEDMKGRIDDHIKEIKLKAWCRVCYKEAAFHCCWGYNYCSETCRNADWNSHTAACTQYSMSATDPHLKLSPRFRELLEKQNSGIAPKKLQIQDLIDSPVGITVQRSPPKKIMVPTKNQIVPKDRLVIRQKWSQDMKRRRSSEDNTEPEKSTDDDDRVTTTTKSATLNAPTAYVAYEGRRCRCRGNDCNGITKAEKEILHREFSSLPTETQTKYLAKLMVISTHKNETRSVKYYVPRKECDVTVCRTTFCDVFGVSPRRLKSIQQRMRTRAPSPIQKRNQPVISDEEDFTAPTISIPDADSPQQQLVRRDRVGVVTVNPISCIRTLPAFLSKQDSSILARRPQAFHALPPPQPKLTYRSPALLPATELNKNLQFSTKYPISVTVSRPSTSSGPPSKVRAIQPALASKPPQRQHTIGIPAEPRNPSATPSFLRVMNDHEIANILSKDHLRDWES